MKAICGVQMIHSKEAKDLMLVLCLNEAIDQLAMANNVHCCDHVLWRYDGHILRRVLRFALEEHR